MMASAGYPEPPRGTDDEMPIDEPSSVQADALLSTPTDVTSLGARIPRAKGVYDNRSTVFAPPEDAHRQQYASLYFVRLLKMRARMVESAKRKWGNDVPIVENTLQLETNVKCCLIGTLYKDMQLKPSVLAEYAQELFVEPPPPRTKYIHADDELVLEDQKGRIKLEGQFPKDELVTGVIVAVLGSETSEGDFCVEDYCFAGLAPQPPLPARTDSDNAPYLALVSGLNIGPENKDMMAIQLLVDYITGSLGGPNEQMFGSRIVRLIVAGNLMGVMPQQKELISFKANKNADNEKELEHAALKEIDTVLAQLASNCPVDAMAGERDTANFYLPQQPMHPCLFPSSRTFSTFQTVTNPYSATVDNVLITGTSGQTIEDIFKYSACENRHEILENTVKWSHLAPTAPDTLACYPFITDDPFVIEACPHIMFAGNQAEYASSLLEGESGQKVRVISLPPFSEQHTMVLVNLETLQCHPISFSFGI